MQSNHEAFINLAKKISTFHMNQHGNHWKEYHENSKFYCEIEPEVFEVIKEYGGKLPNMIVYPMILQVYTEATELFDKIYLLPIFCVRCSKDGRLFKFFDVTGKMYSDASDFVENQSFPYGKMAFPKNFHYDSDDENDHDVMIEFVFTDTEEAIDQFEFKKQNGWIELIATMGLSVTVVFALTATFGTLPAMGAILGGSTMFYGNHQKCDPLDTLLLKSGTAAIGYFESFGVLLPKTYKIAASTDITNSDVQRKLLIMAGYHIDQCTNDVKSNDLFMAVNSYFGDNLNKWQVFCCDELYSFKIHSKPYHFFNANISTRDFIIFVSDIKLPNGNINRKLCTEIQTKYQLKEVADIQTNNRFDQLMHEMAVLLCSNKLSPIAISAIMSQIFNGNWNCFLFSGYHVYKFTFNGYICVKVEDDFYCLYY